MVFDGAFCGSEVALEEVDAEGVFDGLFGGLFVFAGGGDAVFGDCDHAGVVAVEFWGGGFGGIFVMGKIWKNG